MAIRKIEAGRVITRDLNQFIGTLGTIFYDEYSGEFRLSDGHTPGGVPLNSGGSGPSTVTVSEINAANSITNQVVGVTTLRFDKDTGFNVEDIGNGQVKISLGSTFKTWKVDGQPDLVAVGEDTIQFVAGAGISISTDPDGPVKRIVISSSNTNTGTSISYELPVSTTSTLGGVVIGTGLTVTPEGVVSLNSAYQINKLTDISDINSSTLENGALLVYNQGANRWDTKTDVVSDTIDGGEF